MTPGRGSKCTTMQGNPGNGGLIACLEARHAKKPEELREPEKIQPLFPYPVVPPQRAPIGATDSRQGIRPKSLA
jgi:hypothetical protein